MCGHKRAKAMFKARKLSLEGVVTSGSVANILALTGHTFLRGWHDACLLLAMLWSCRPLRGVRVLLEVMRGWSMLVMTRFCSG